MTYLDCALLKAESFLHHWSQLPNATTLFTKYILSPGCQYNNFSTSWCHTHFNTTVTIFGQFSSEEFIQFGLKNSIRNELNNWKEISSPGNFILFCKTYRNTDMTVFHLFFTHVKRDGTLQNRSQSGLLAKVRRYKWHKAYLKILEYQYNSILIHNKAA